MQLQVHGKQMDVGDALRTHVQDKLTDVNEKYFNHTTYATVTFSREGHGHPQTKAHINIQLGKNIMVAADATEKDPYVAFDQASEKAAKQMRRYKRKIRDHHEREDHTPELEIAKAKKYILASATGQDNESDEIEANDEPAIIAEMSKDIMTLSISDAVMHLDLSGEPAVVFRNKANRKINFLYRRADGNIGWVDPDHHTDK
jgi:ribosomal subunit interface protein